MEFISSKCEISYFLEPFSCQELKEVLISKLEGRLTISVDGVDVFNEENILLAEFYVYLYSWVYQDYFREGFVYESMDYEDSPIIKVSVQNDYCTICSIWMTEGLIEPVSIFLNDFLNAAKKFLKKLESDLLIRGIKTDSLRGYRKSH